MSGLLDLGPESLEQEPVQDLIVSITEAVIAGKPAPKLPARTSRLTSGEFAGVTGCPEVEEQGARNRGLRSRVVQSQAATWRFWRGQGERTGPDRGRLEARRGERSRRSGRPGPQSRAGRGAPQAGTRHDAPLTEARRTPRRPEPDATPIAADLKRRIQHLLRQINQALASVGFDSHARKSVLTKFVRERFSSVAGQADVLADEILRETTTTPPTVTPVPVPPVIPQVTATAGTRSSSCLDTPSRGIS